MTETSSRTSSIRFGPASTLNLKFEYAICMMSTKKCHLTEYMNTKKHKVKFISMQKIILNSILSVFAQSLQVFVITRNT